MYVMSGRGTRFGSNFNLLFCKTLWVHIIIVTCGNVSGSLYLSKLDESKKPQPKCILVNGSWYSPPEFESFAGGKAEEVETVLAPPWKAFIRLFPSEPSVCHTTCCCC